MNQDRQRIAVIGAGVSGLTAAWLLSEHHDVELFEAADYAGGHPNTELVKAGWETLVEAGYNPDVAYFECLHELKLIVDLLHEGGLTRMHQFVSTTASFGHLTRGRRVVGEGVRERL